MLPVKAIGLMKDTDFAFPLHLSPPSLTGCSFLSSATLSSLSLPSSFPISPLPYPHLPPISFSFTLSHWMLLSLYLSSSSAHFSSLSFPPSFQLSLSYPTTLPLSLSLSLSLSLLLDVALHLAMLGRCGGREPRECLAPSKHPTSSSHWLPSKLKTTKERKQNWLTQHQAINRPLKNLCSWQDTMQHPPHAAQHFPTCIDSIRDPTSVSRGPTSSLTGMNERTLPMADTIRTESRDSRFARLA